MRSLGAAAYLKKPVERPALLPAIAAATAIAGIENLISAVDNGNLAENRFPAYQAMFPPRNRATCGTHSIINHTPRT